MSLTRVKMSEEVWLTCLTHALSTETEEIMGLLLGDIQKSRDGNVTAMIWGALPQLRSDRRKDRVETNPEQLTAASVQAEKMTATIGRTTRVIGWYHSHPHITVLPSHVDVRTQAMYQLLDPGFIGLIFSCYSEDARKVGRIQVTAFQSLDGKQQQLHNLRPVNRSPVIDLDSSLSSSDQIFFRGDQQDTADSKSGRSSDLGGFFANVDARAGEKAPVTDIDPMDMSDSMQEALHRSTMEMSGAEYVRKEVLLNVLPASSLLALDSPMESFLQLQRVLYEEEKIACDQAIEESMRDGRVHPLTYIHHKSTYQASICKLMEYCLSPAISALQDQVRENETRLRLLADEAKSLETLVSKGSESHRSPRNLQPQSLPRTQSSPRSVQTQNSPRSVQTQSSPRSVQTQSSPRNLRSNSLGHRDRDLYSAGEFSGKSTGGPSSRTRRGS